MDNQMSLKRQIHALEFALLELNLFLDTHPGNSCAMNKRCEYMAEKAELIAQYEAQYGPYIRTAADVQGDTWCWVKGPWPWELGGEC